MPLHKTVAVTGFSWERIITIEEERTVQESNWYVPSGGRVYFQQEEIRDYKDVLDHYETRYETKTREVFDHYDTYYTYEDNGNGTFTEEEHSTPVYRTETYTDSYDVPIYRTEPVYDTKYYYEIERWFETYDYTSSEDDHSPYWYTNYTLADNERDTNRTESYYVHFDDGTYDKLPESEWQNIQIGDSYVITYNRVGIIYKETALE